MQEQNIELMNYIHREINFSDGQNKIKCMYCKDDRKKNKGDRPLSVNVDQDKIVYNCFHCGTSGIIYKNQKERVSVKTNTKPLKKIVINNNQVEGACVDWLKSRGITAELAVRNGCILNTKNGKPVIGFSFKEGDKVTAIKWRVANGEKTFYWENNCKRLWGNNVKDSALDDIESTIVIVEGELDQLSVKTAFADKYNIECYSVPNGAPSKVSNGKVDPSEDGRFKYVWNDQHLFKDKQKIILATDDDSSGDALADKEYLVAVKFFQRQNTLAIGLAADINLSQAIAWQVVAVESKTHLHFDHKQNRIRCANQQVIGSLVISEENTLQKLSTELFIECWCQQIRKRGLSWLKLDEQTQQLLLRWRWLNQTQKHLAFEDVSEIHLLSTLEQWLGPYLVDITSKAQLDKLNLAEALLSQLSYQQQQIFNQLAPNYFTGPTGRKCKIRYSLEQAPIVSLPMQELYGVSSTPSVGDSNHNSQVALIIELLSPAQRPIQITQDLVAFWQGSYREVQKDMRSKYPKHFWPDDPANAQATRKTKRHIKG